MGEGLKRAFKAARDSQQRVAMPRPTYEIVARVGKNWARVTEAPDLRGVWAVTEHEITHGADSVNITVKRHSC